MFVWLWPGKSWTEQASAGSVPSQPVTVNGHKRKQSEGNQAFLSQATQRLAPAPVQLGTIRRKNGVAANSRLSCCGVFH